MKRKTNYELLRIVAMLMIIALHYLDKGGILPKLNTDFNGAGYVAWLVEAFCLMAVNVYVLLSGYFGVESHWRIQKAVTLWGQVFFYSIFCSLQASAMVRQRMRCPMATFALASTRI
jgi:surface polysaccharide O-acyltransferase-like enzyme